MTSFGYWADRVPDGYFLCCLCFEVFPLEKAATDEAGDRVDMCFLCWAMDPTLPVVEEAP